MSSVFSGALDDLEMPAYLQTSVHPTTPNAVMAIQARIGVDGETDPATITGALAAAVTSIATHAADTTAIHGIADTAALVLTGDSRLSDARTPTAHATSHQAGGSDSIRLDDLAAPEDNTDLNASTSAHGLMQKYPGGTTTFLRADGSFATPTASAGDFDRVLAANSTVSANKSRVICGPFRIPDTFTLTIADTAAMRVC